MSFLRKTFFVSSGQIFSLLIGVVSSSIMSRLLGPEKLGNLELVRSTQTILTAIFALGVGQASIYFYNSKKISIEDIIASTFMFFGISAFLFLFANIILHKYVDHYFGNLSTIELSILFSYGILLLFNTYHLPLFTARLETKNIVLSNALPKLTTLIILTLLFVINISTLKYALLSILLGYVVSSIYIAFSLPFKSVFVKIANYQLLYQLVKYGIKLSASNILYLISNNTILFLIRIFNLDSFKDLGLFTRAIVLSNLVIIIPNTIAPLFYSRWASLVKESREKEFLPIIQLSFLLSFAVSLTVFLLAKHIVIILFGSQFVDSVVYIKLLAPVFVFTTITQVCLNYFNSSGLAIKPFYVMLINLMLNILVGYFAISIWDIKGAAYTLMITNFIVSLISLKMVSININHDFYSLFDFTILYRYIKKSFKHA